MNPFQSLKERKVLDKDGKVDALGPYGKSKLTGREISSYFKKNKVKDPEVRKAVEVALDLGGAMDIAIKAIKNYYGNKILKAKEVQQALKFANESFTYNQAINQLSEKVEISEGKNLMPDIQKIVDTKGAAKVGGIMVDMFTASMISQIYDKVNDSNKKKMEKSNISTLVDLAQRLMRKSENNPLEEGTMALGIFDSNPSKKNKAIAGMKKLIKNTKPSVKVGSPEGKKFFKQLDLKYLSDDELADDFARPSNKNMTVKDLLQKHAKRLGIQFEQVEEAANPAQQAAIAISKKEKAGKPGYDKEGKSLKNKQESVMDAYRKMWEDGQKYAPELEEESLEEKLSKQDLKFIDMMYDKKGKLTDVGRAVMNYKPGDNIRKIVNNLNNKKK